MVTRLSTRLKELRRISSLSATEVIKELKNSDLDYSEQSIYKWEQGNAIPRFETLKVLSKIYGCNISYLIEGKKYKYLHITPCEYQMLNIYRTDFLFRSILTQIINKLSR